MESYLTQYMSCGWTDGFREKGRSASGDEAAVPPNAILHIDLHLVSWKTVIEIGNDKKIKKMILQEGEGYNRPNDCATVKGIFYCSLYMV
jgi:peptidylprolyl isomerase